ncbi:molecular chaperone TorD family protein [Carboxydochorda subterranea]|uniref:Molecular chaperone TorD family protein n=1 Tax=Carboxydichorda subterranea TaxID=3109565 RepID=A0ABZ1BXR2_9FIRM|nr:molecular chaperone TorD family protein [Limnochorda sp. L945t]WRP16852.1 molecular chaperone TorD family protein [Limnochorda sp. L945t]
MAWARRRGKRRVRLVRVIICSKRALFRKGLERLLAEASGIEVVAQESDVEQALERARKTGADCLVVDCTDSRVDPAQVAARVMKEHLSATVVGLNLRDNTLLVFRGRRRVVGGVSDLMESLKGNGAGRTNGVDECGTGAGCGAADSVPPTHDELAKLAENRSRIYGFLASVYNQLPDDGFAAKLRDPALVSELEGLSAQEGIWPEVREGARLVAEFVRAVQGQEVEGLKTALAVDRTRLLRGIRPGYGPPPPYESVYVGSDHQPRMQATVDVVKAYAEAGVGLPEAARDQPDFIGYELDFLRYLAEREAEAWRAGDADKAIEALEMQEGFLSAHAARWIPRFCELMEREAKLDFYRGIALITKGFVGQEVESLPLERELLRSSGETQTSNRGGLKERTR